MGNSDQREGSRDDVSRIGDRRIGDDEQSCLLDREPRLTALAIVAGARAAQSGHYWTTLHAVRTATVRATTDPPDAAGITWTGPVQGAAATVRTLSRAAAGRIKVQASLDVTRSVRLHVFDLVSLVSDLPIAVAGTTRKGYAGFIPNNRARLTATVNPASDPILGTLTWSAGVAGVQAGERLVDVSAVGNQTVTATLGTSAMGSITQQVVLQVHQWPLLEIQELTFSRGHDIDNDTLGNFDRQWTRARVGQTAPARFNPPQCYVRNTQVELTATLRVTRQPTGPENVVVRGTATVGGQQLVWTSAAIAVAVGAATVNFPAPVLSVGSLPNQVGSHPAVHIDWEMSDPNGGWIPIGRTTPHHFYVTLGDPAGGVTVHWTLLDYSCQHAAGTNTPANFVPAAFNTYTGLNVRRKRDNRPMTYWDPRSVARGNGNTAALLGSDTRRQWNSQDDDGTPNMFCERVATGHCGSWAHSFLDMLRIHGVVTAHKVYIGNRDQLRGPNAGNANVITSEDGVFLIRTWNFATPPALNGAALTHNRGVNCTRGPYAPGQSNLTPPPQFRNHFVVYCMLSNRIYDPSYGTFAQGVNLAAALLAWEMAGISGLYSPGAAPNAGFATAALPAPGRRLRFYDLDSVPRVDL